MSRVDLDSYRRAVDAARGSLPGSPRRQDREGCAICWALTGLVAGMSAILCTITWWFS